MVVLQLDPVKLEGATTRVKLCPRSTSLVNLHICV